MTIQALRHSLPAGLCSAVWLNLYTATIPVHPVLAIKTLSVKTYHIHNRSTLRISTIEAIKKVNEKNPAEPGGTRLGLFMISHSTRPWLCHHHHCRRHQFHRIIRAIVDINNKLIVTVTFSIRNNLSKVCLDMEGSPMWSFSLSISITTFLNLNPCTCKNVSFYLFLSMFGSLQVIISQGCLVEWSAR